MCTLNFEDTIEHRLLFCPSDIQKRLTFHNDILKLCGTDVLSAYLQLDISTKINWLLGDGVYDTWGHEKSILFDKCTKQFLTSIYVNIKERLQSILT